MIKKLKHFIAVQALKLAVRLDFITAIKTVQSSFENKPDIRICWHKVNSDEEADKMIRDVTGKIPRHGSNEGTKWAQVWETKDGIDVVAFY